MVSLNLKEIHYHYPNRARFPLSNSQFPNPSPPPFLFSFSKVRLPSDYDLFYFHPPIPIKKSLVTFSSFLPTSLRILKRQNKLEYSLTPLESKFKSNLPPLDKQPFYQPSSLLDTLSITRFQKYSLLGLSPRGNPK